MRKFIIAGVVAVLMCLAFSSCSSSEPNDNFSSTHVKNSGKNLIYTAIRESSSFETVKVDGIDLIENDHYSVEPGSENITFFADFFDMLTLGEHSISVTFKDGVTEAGKITVETANEN